MALSIRKTVTKCKSPGRVGTGAVKAIFLHSIEEDIANIIQDARNCCKRGCLSSVHYVVDVAGCVIHQFVPETDTAWGFDWTDPTLDPPPCPPATPACQPCGVCTIETTDAIFAGEAAPLANLDPNAFVIHVALAMPIAQVPSGPTDQAGFSEDCEADLACKKLGKCSYDTLVALLADIFARFPSLTPSATTLRKKGCGLDCIDVPTLITDILTVPPAPVPFSRLCADLKAFADGTPVTVFGADAAGNCVKGAASFGPDVFLQSGAYDDTTNLLTLTLTDNSTVVIDMTTLLADVTPSPAALCNGLAGITAGVTATGDTKVVINGAGCKLVPDVPVDVCAALTALPPNGAALTGVKLFGANGANCVSVLPTDIICSSLAVMPVGPTVPAGTRFVGDDCVRYDISLCAQVQALPVGAVAATDQVVAFNATDGCRRVSLTGLTAGVAPTSQNHVNIPTQYYGQGNPTPYYLGQPRAWLTVNHASIPGGVGVIPVY